MTTKISDFIANVNKMGIARPNLFEFQITPPPGMGKINTRDVTLYCQSTNVPSLSVMTGTVRVDDVPFEVPYGTAFEPLQAMFYLDTNWVIRQFFTTWYSLIFDHNSKAFGYYRDYVGSIVVTQYARSSQKGVGLVPTNAIKFSDVYPKSYGGVQYGQGQNDDIMTFPMEFVYTKREIVKPGSSGDGILNDLLGSVFDRGENKLKQLIDNSIKNTLLKNSSLIKANTFVSLTKGINILSKNDKSLMKSLELPGILSSTRGKVSGVQQLSGLIATTKLLTRLI